MSGWLLTQKAAIDEDLDASALTELISMESSKQISSIVLNSSRPRRGIDVGELFDIKPIHNGDNVVIRGDLARLHRLANGWHSVALLVEGSVGSQFAVNMRSGKVQVDGSVGDGLATQMRGGEVRVVGSAGACVGAPLPGRRSGMSGGRVVIGSDAGHSLGYRLRRGMLLVHGNCGDGAGRDMVAGTIVISGNTGMHLGAGMKRGTIVIATKPVLDAPRFTKPCNVQLGVAALLAGNLESESRLLASGLRGRFDRVLGDVTARGKGEIWMLPGGR